MDRLPPSGAAAGGRTELPRLGTRSASAGTGTTIVALHRAVDLARAHPDARAFLTTFSTELADGLPTRLTKRIANEPKIAERLEVGSMGEVGGRL